MGVRAAEWERAGRGTDATALGRAEAEAPYQLFTRQHARNAASASSGHMSAGEEPLLSLALVHWRTLGNWLWERARGARARKR